MIARQRTAGAGGGQSFGSAGNLEVDERGHHTGIEMIQEVAGECPPAGIVGVKSIVTLVFGGTSTVSRIAPGNR